MALFALGAWTEKIHSGKGLEAIMEMISNVVNNTITPQELGRASVAKEEYLGLPAGRGSVGRSQGMSRLVTTAWPCW